MTPGWYPDPTGRFPQRYFDGRTWTEQVVGANGMATTDSGADLAALPAPSTPDPIAPQASDGPAGDRQPAERSARRPLRMVALLVVLLAIVGAAGAFFVLREDDEGPESAAPVGLESDAPSGGDGAGAVVTISDPSALAPPGGVPVPPTAWPDATMEWKTDQDWSSVLAWYYSSFPIDGLALDPSDLGKSSTNGVPTGESHAIITAGTTGAPGLAPYLKIQADPENPNGGVVSLVVYD